MSSTDTIEVLEAIHDAVFFVDVESDEILETNERACDLLGYDRTELLSLGPSDIHPNEMDRLREFVASARRTGESMASDLHCLRKDGRKIPIEASASTAQLRGESGVLIVVRDISNAKRQNHYLKVFDRVVRHNLRNQMSILLGCAEYIEANVADESVSDQSALLCHTVEDLVELVENIRTVQQSIRTDLDSSARFDCATALEQVVSNIQSEYPSATVVTDLPESLYAHADNQLCLAFEHVIENAIVHNESDRPNVEIIATRITDHEIVEIKIVDDGPGIPTDEQLLVTDPDDISPLEHGSGLGLWVASMIVASFDGSLAIEDNEPVGSSVTFWVPRAAARPISA